MALRKQPLERPIRGGNVIPLRARRSRRPGWRRAAPLALGFLASVLACLLIAGSWDAIGAPRLIARAAAQASCPFLGVHDGDTIRCGGERIRIANIDAPELPDSPKCEDYRRRYAWCDFALGYRSRDALKAFLAHGRIEIRRQGRDKYGRTLATVSVGGVDAGDWLVRQGLARRWR